MWCLWRDFLVSLSLYKYSFVLKHHQLTSIFGSFGWNCSKDHVRYELHKCQSSYKKDIQVPVCPLCNQPVPWKRGEAPDISVSDHIDRDCQSDPAKQKRKVNIEFEKVDNLLLFTVYKLQVFGNQCSMKGCKKKEGVPIVCDQCKMNFCLRHRHSVDHSCKGNNPVDRARYVYILIWLLKRVLTVYLYLVVFLGKLL